MTLSYQAEDESVDDPTEEVVPEPPKKSLDDGFKDYEEKSEEESTAALNSRKASILTNLKREMTLFESSGNKGKMLEQLHTALLSIPPTSVEVRKKNSDH